MSRRTPDPIKRLFNFVYEAFTLYGIASQRFLLSKNFLKLYIDGPNPHSEEWFVLFPLRSPLLRESHSLSFPLGTKMFHFPRYPINMTMYSSYDTIRLRIVGCPIQKSLAQSLLPAPQGLSQVVTSFIGS